MNPNVSCARPPIKLALTLVLDVNVTVYVPADKLLSLNLPPPFLIVLPDDFRTSFIVIPVIVPPVASNWT
jgi:hypothetical protein